MYFLLCRNGVYVCNVRVLCMRSTVARGLHFPYGSDYIITHTHARDHCAVCPEIESGIHLFLGFESGPPGGLECGRVSMVTKSWALPVAMMCEWWFLQATLVLAANTHSKTHCVLPSHDPRRVQRLIEAAVGIPRLLRRLHAARTTDRVLFARGALVCQVAAGGCVGACGLNANL